ncbi:MAG: DNA polymerase III subunit delta' [Gammaproteobacteria bacterium]|nr:DNA polymerase III subunit delta' [Gammaproteobacteria bacterium]PCH62251.1 MAG: DNA polymerase III subunit delta' [Gammaproteobacteria bacterium]
MTHPAHLPWHESLWTQLEQSLSQERLAHAYLLQGPAGVGKSQFAQHLAKSLLCEQSAFDACGQCKSCHLFQVGSHPDLRQLASEAGKAIGIDVVRETSSFFSLTRQYGRYQIAIITDAERMTTAAANALLKTLEEPPAGALLMLISEQASLLPITVRSRCQSLRFTLPAPEVSLAWLQQQGVESQQAPRLLDSARGAPLHAITLSSETEYENQRSAVVEGARNLYFGRTGPVDLAASYLKLGAKQALYSLWQWKAEMVRNLAMNKASADDALAQRLGQRRLLLRIDGLSAAIKRLDSQLNEQLILEDILISWV